MSNNIIQVLLSGGVGTRLWPLSRKAKPKQYLPIFEGQTLFQKTVLRNLEFCTDTLIVGNQAHAELWRKELENTANLRFREILEASPRNTAAAIAFAAWASAPEDILFVTPSDHLIEGDSSYATAVHRAILLAKQGNLVTLGLRPTHPETGYGYIECAGEEVLCFREKPDLPTAAEFVAKGNFYWNSGIFCFPAGLYLSELQAYEPLLFQAALTAWQEAEDGHLDFERSEQIPPISVDYAVMERSTKLKVVPSTFSWSDMGSFESIYQYLQRMGHPTDPNGNMVIGSSLHTEFAGLKNTLLVQTQDAILLLQREQAQEVKHIYSRLEKEHPALS